MRFNTSILSNTNAQAATAAGIQPAMAAPSKRPKQHQRQSPWLRQSSSIFLVALAATLYGVTTLAHPTPPLQEHSTEPACHLSREVSKGGTFRIELHNSGGTGAEWFVYPPPDILLVAQGIKPSDSTTGLVGSPVTYWWDFLLGGTEHKMLQIQFYLYRRWEGKDKAFKRCVVDVVVQ